MPEPLDVTVIVLSYNEAIDIERCIRRISPYVRRVVVVDSYSSDDTVERAQALGAQVLCSDFVNRSQQFNWALDNLEIDTAWTLRLDGDEHLDDEALDWLERHLAALPDEAAGVEFRRRMIFRGRPLRHGGGYPTDCRRLWRTGRGRVEESWMDERTILDGAVVKAAGNLVDESLDSIGSWTEKHNHDASRQAIGFVLLRGSAEHRGGGDRIGPLAAFKRSTRNRVYARLPLYVRPFLYWAYRYFALGGLLDGKRGLIFHFLHGFWYRMLIDVKIAEAERIVARGGLPALAEHYRRAHGIVISLPGRGGTDGGS